MKMILHIFKTDLKNLLTRFFPLVIAIGVCILPSLYAWFNIYSNWDPYGNTGNIKIAVANLDRGYVKDDGKSVNIGNNVVDSLRDNKSIGWTFVDTEEEAVDGVESGEYYAAVVINSDFSEVVFHVLQQDIQNPTITYYENEKKNAVATKITDTAVSTLKSNINKQFIETAVEILFEQTNQIADDLSENNKLDKIIDTLQMLDDNLKAYDNMITQMLAANDALSGEISDANAKLPAMSNSVSQSANSISSASGSIDNTKDSLNQYQTTLNNSLNSIQSSLNGMAGAFQNSGLSQNTADATNTIIDAQNNISDVQKQINQMLASLDLIYNINDVVTNLPSGTNPETPETPNAAEIASSIEEELRPSVEASIKDQQESIAQSIAQSIANESQQQSMEQAAEDLSSQQAAILESLNALASKLDSQADAQQSITNQDNQTLPEITLPEITLPETSAKPEVTTPAITAPEVTTPAITVPEVTTPAVTVPEVTTPAVTLPEVTTPAVTAPDVTIPDITIPDITIPDITIPETQARGGLTLSEFPKIDISIFETSAGGDSSKGADSAASHTSSSIRTNHIAKEKEAEPVQTEQPEAGGFFEDKLFDKLSSEADGKASSNTTNAANKVESELQSAIESQKDEIRESAESELQSQAASIAQEQIESAAQNIANITMPVISDTTKDQIELAKTSLATIQNGLTEINNLLASMAIASAGQQIGNNIDADMNQVASSINSCAGIINNLQGTFQNSLVPQMNNVLNGVTATLDCSTDMMNGIAGLLNNMTYIFSGIQATVTGANISLEDIQSAIRVMSTQLENVIDTLSITDADERYQKLLEIFGADPEEIAEFLSEPVKVETVPVYYVENYGSAVAPFYTALALWVGGIILVAIVKVKATKEAFPGATRTQLFLGRYLIFFVLGQLQTVICVLGNLYLLKCQVQNVGLYFLTASVTSFTFTLLIYAMTVSFGDIGKALVVVLVVIQIAGSSGTYPIEILPQFYQNVYIFFPFPYAINAFRETIAGFYKNDYAIYMLQLLSFAAASLLLGLVIRIPFIKLNHYMEERMEDTKMM